MEKLRRGLDGIKLQSLTAKVTALDEEIKQHKTICADCSLHENSARFACAQGWQLLKDKSRADNALAIYKGFEPAGTNKDQGVLF